VEIATPQSPEATLKRILATGIFQNYGLFSWWDSRKAAKGKDVGDEEEENESEEENEENNEEEKQEIDGMSQESNEEKAEIQLLEEKALAL
jgi:hypothetical protein